MITKKFIPALSAFALAVAALAGCANPAVEDKAATPDAAKESAVEAGGPIDAEAFDALVAGGATASDEEIAASEWATKVKEAGTLRVGTTATSYLFSQQDETDQKLRGFDAGLYQLLTRYILGDESKFEFTQLDSGTREQVLQTNVVDVVVATYSITPEREEVISYAGPYYTSRQGILVSADNGEIMGLEDLAGKNVATQAESTGPAILAEFAPDAVVQEFGTDQEARTAVEQGRVDAYVTDATLIANSIVKDPGKYKLVGEPFGPEDNYGIGLPKDSDGVQFVNDFLKKIEADGTWAELWKLSIGDRSGITEVPAPPAIG